MARKRGEYQRRKERENKLISVFCVFMLVIFIPMFLTYGIIDNALGVQHINNNSLHEYTGTFTYELKKGYGKRSRARYVFTLDNGDIVSIPKRYCKNEEFLDECQELTIRYDTILFSDGHSAVSITTSDGEIEILDLNLVYGLCVANTWICSIMLVFSVTLAIFIIIMAYHIDWKRRFRVWRKKRKRKKANRIDKSNIT